MVQHKNIQHRLVIRYQDTGASPGDLPPAGNADPPEGIKPDVPGSPETGPEMQYCQPFIKPACNKPYQES